MVTARIAIKLDEEFGVTAVSRAHPAAVFRYLSGIAEPDRGLGLVSVTASDLDGILADLATVSVIRGFEILEREGRSAVFRYETDVAVLYTAVREADIIPAFPYTIRDGTLEFTATTSSARLSALGDQLRERDIRFDISSLAHGLDDRATLTDRQREVILAAVEWGYYETPRRLTLSELAEELEIATSTASRLLNRAEGRIVTRFAMNVGGDPAGERTTERSLTDRP